MKSAKGFTLIEVVLAIIIIAVISAGGFEFFRFCQRFIMDSELRVEAVNFARDTMEKFYWDNTLPITADWVSNGEELPAGSRLLTSYSGNRRYRVGAGSSADYIVLKTKVEWTY